MRLWSVVVVLMLLLGACSGADEGVRTIGSEESGSGSSSGTGSDTASATGTGSDAASATGTASGTASASGTGSTCVPPSEPSTTAIAVTLTEWEVGTPDEVPVGDVTVTAGNIGTDAHELVIVKGSDPGSLPVADGKVQEDQLAEGDLIGEIESFPSGDTCTGTFALPAGDYVFFCNIVAEEPDGTVRSHFDEGMRTVVTVG